MNIKYLPPQELPALRVAEAPTSCTQVELLAALIGGPQQLEIAGQLFQQFGSLRALHQAFASEIAKIPGIGQKTAARVISALELGKRLVSETTVERPCIHSPADAANLIQYEMSTLEQEELWVLLLNTRNRVMEIEKLYRGSLNSSQVRVGEIFKAAIRRNAAALIVVHNHPSGDPVPSPDDVAITRAIVEAGQLVDIQLLDHLVIGHHGWVSLKERSLGGL